MPRNRMRIPILSAVVSLAVSSALSLGCLLTASAVARAQNNFDLAIHANSDVSPADIGLPAYPGATPAHKHGDDKAAFDIGFSYGDTHFRMRGISYDSDDSPGRILDFYRKALGRYGDVLECDHGRPVGSLTVTSSGLRCSDRKNGDHLNIDGHIRLIEGPRPARRLARGIPHRRASTSRRVNPLASSSCTSKPPRTLVTNSGIRARPCGRWCSLSTVT